jgi:hypothetical protein
MNDNPQLREILDQASELSPDKRPAFLTEACGGNEQLRAEIESLLRALDDSGDPAGRPWTRLAAASGHIDC